MLHSFSELKQLVQKIFATVIKLKQTTHTHTLWSNKKLFGVGCRRHRFTAAGSRRGELVQRNVYEAIEDEQPHSHAQAVDPGRRREREEVIERKENVRVVVLFSHQVGEVDYRLVVVAPDQAARHEHDHERIGQLYVP